MTIDYAALAANHDPKAVKGAVNLAGVMLAYGINLETNDDGRLVGLCPFHDDERPSFAVWRWYDSDEWACGCWACDFGPGDLFDFLRRWHDCDFRTAMARALELRDGELPEAPDVPVNDGPAPDFGRMFENAHDTGAVVDLLNERNIHVPADWLCEEFRVRANGDTVLVPHFAQTGELTGIKRRWAAAGWTPIAAKGSRLDDLYGVWRTRNRPEIIVCEGESDTWTVAKLFAEQPLDVVGLPSGVSTKPRDSWVDFLRGRDVVLLFDADRAGREGVGRWLAALSGTARSTRVACLPDGTDASSAGPVTTRQAVDEAWPFVNPTSLPIAESGGRYIRRSRSEDQADTVLSDFVLQPLRLIVMEDGGVVFTVSCPTKADPQLLTSAELSSVEKMRRWAADRLMSWKGGTRDLADLLELLKAKAILVPRLRGTDVVGLHRNVFVLPDDVIGPAGWGYVPPDNDVSLGSSIRLERGGAWDRDLPLQLTALHRPDVVTPILGWVAAAPLRSLVAKFPVLTVTGGSGWGKTTLLQTILGAFGFWTATPVTLTGATAHGVHSYAGSTNAIPVWVDEYRPGARPEARLALDQIIRDAWDGSATIKGGLSENRMRVKKLPARAPIVVTGEDVFSETSHAERMVMVQVPKNGRNVDALVTVQSMAKEGFGRAYLEWLLASLATDTLPTAPNHPNRQVQTRAVAGWGYDLLDQFCREVLGYELPAFDSSLILRAHNATDETPVILEAAIEAIGHFDRDNHPIAWQEGPDLYVKPIALCKWVEQHTDIQLPGRSKAVTAWFIEQYGATSIKHPVYNRVLCVPRVLDTDAATQ